VKIPQKVIQNCVGLAIFTVIRTGLWVSGAGGSGILIARKEDGSWSPPSGLLVHTLGVGFMAGIDIYDCVIVINSRKALEAFSKLRVSLGGELSVVAGPVGVGGVLESEVMKDRKPIWSYVKSRGLYGGLQIDGTIIIERNDENAKFYGERLPVGQILAGNVKHIPQETRMLMEVVKAAEGRTDVDSGVMAQADSMPPPGDVEVEKMSEPTHEQKVNFAAPQGYEHPPPQPPRPGSQGAYSGAGYHPEAESASADHAPGAYQQPPNLGASAAVDYGAGTAAYQHPARTDSGFAAPPPGPPPPRTDSGFPAPPGPPPSQGKQDPDGPPRYSY
jgi:lipid-binding SYLF domain-containing protein